jgi:predicted secreted protein
MERQKPTTSVRNNDGFSQALIESYGRWMGGQGFGGHLNKEETYPELQKKGGEDDFSKKDPKANAAAPDPVVDLRTGSGVKQSHGATIKYTNVVAKEEKEEKEGVSKKGENKFHKKLDKLVHKSFGKSSDEKKMKESFNLFVEGIHYVFEKKNDEGKEQGADGKACWKGYKYAGTENGKDECVKAGYDPIGEVLIDEKAPPGDKYERMVKHIKKGYSKDGNLSKDEKGIAYATAQKAKNKSMKEGLDSVGKEDKDIDNDGDHDKSDKYLAARRKKVNKVIATKKKMKEQVELRKEIDKEKK